MRILVCAGLSALASAVAAFVADESPDVCHVSTPYYKRSCSFDDELISDGLSLLQRSATLTKKSRLDLSRTAAREDTSAHEFRQSVVNNELSAIFEPHLHHALHAPLPPAPDDIWVLTRKRISLSHFGVEPYGGGGNASMQPTLGPLGVQTAPPGDVRGVISTLGDVWSKFRDALHAPGNVTAAHIVGVEKNARGDVAALELNLLVNGSIILAVLIIFTFCLRFRYPTIYQNNVEADVAPRHLQDSYASWLVGSCTLTIDEVADTISLDGAMLLEFTHLGMKVMAVLAIPLMGIMAPLDAFYGGAAQIDGLSIWSMNNLVTGSWLYWVYMCIVWIVVIVVVQFTWAAKVSFIGRRFKWLREMPKPRATTILVENIPEECRSDQALKAYFGKMFGQKKVREAIVVKQLPGLEKAVNAKTEAERGIHSNSFQLKAINQLLGSVTKNLDTLHEMNLTKNLDDFKRDKEEAKGAIKTQRALMEQLAPLPGGVNTGVGFVTFSDRNVCEIARHLTYTQNAREWRMSQPPDPQSVRWNDLKSNPECTATFQILGYAMIVVLYIAYLPIVVYISIFCTSINMGWFEPVWDAFAPSLGLTVVVSLMPMALATIARYFFRLKDDTVAQHKIQVWDFWFQVTYVLMVTAIGTSIASFLKEIAMSPLAIFRILAITLPWSTHFYANYLVMQMTFEVLNLCRYANLFKFLMFSPIYDAEVARALAEPEDQNYYGMGARSTNFVIYLNIGLIFSTLCPVIAGIAFVTFAMLRLTYGYLIPFAETRKSDQGGLFFQSQLQHIFIGLEIYCILMTGVLFQQADSSIPGLVCIPSIFYVGNSLHRFNNSFHWKKLPWEEIMQLEPEKHTEEEDHQYVQPEILASETTQKHIDKRRASSIFGDFDENEMNKSVDSERTFPGGALLRTVGRPKKKMTPEEAGAEQEDDELEEKRIDPHDNKACTLLEIMGKYKDVYTAEEAKVYFRSQCVSPQTPEHRAIAASSDNI